MVPSLWIESKCAGAKAAAVWEDVCRPVLSVWASVFVFERLSELKRTSQTKKDILRGLICVKSYCIRWKK